MIPDEYDIDKLKLALGRGGRSDLKFAYEFADRIVASVEQVEDKEQLAVDFPAYRARNDYVEDYDPENGQIHFHPLTGSELGAPPPEKTLLGRFNAPNHPVLYLSTTPEVALAETRALPSDTCTIANFRIVRPVKIATLLRHNKEPFGVLLDDDPGEEIFLRWLLARTAEFISRRVPDHDRDLHYRTCNLIASAFSDSGYDGLAYRTSFWSPGWRDENGTPEEDHVRAANIVLFDPGIAIPKWSALYRINWKRPIAEKDGNSVWRSKT
ncbi:RES family NAD+ phosphorylase [Roseibium litorale]|uniref:RES family NAD+ phosphorylase n=1 Tax=Roseibium litorale TaxID=2803841 RepID=A0ABR9CH60_9HYPH|nr:RES family NAD+ phosphorylase [Roseibium litorale]MBD8890189.1 RES family NAD+ phosphorylase [Roseibium litorale]